MQFKFQEVEEALVVMLEGRLMAEQETSLVRSHLETSHQNGRRKFIFDMKAVEFVNSACLNFLVAAHNMVTGQEGRLILCNVPDQLRRLLQVTKLDTFFTVAGRTADALEMFRSDSRLIP